MPTLTFYVEMAGNRIMNTTNNDLLDPPPPDMQFTLKLCEASVRQLEIERITREMEVLAQFAEEYPDDVCGYSALFTANQMVNDVIGGQQSQALVHSDTFFSKRNGERAHTLMAIGMHDYLYRWNL